jgi:hypothetical protein
MNENNLDDLVSAHREGVRLTGDQLRNNRARLLSRVAAGATVAASATTSTAVAATSSHFTATLVVKVVIGLIVVGGAGTAYYASRPAPPVAVLPAPVVEAKPAPASNEQSTPDPVQVAEPVADIAPPSPRTPKASASSPSAGSASSLAGEIQLMHDVESALSSGQPGRALQLLDDAAKSGHGGRYAGTMGEERAAARVVTLCRLGRVDEARAEAARFVRDRPRSPLVERVRSTCAKGSEPR